MSDEFSNATEAGSASGETWDLEKQPILIGTYKNRKENVGINKSNVYIIDEDEKDEPTSVWGSTVLDTKFEEIPVGSRVKIEYLGKVKGKAPQPYKDYKVLYVKPDNWVEQAKAQLED